MQHAEPEKIVGGDFGVPAAAGNQAKKIIVIESLRRGDRSYRVQATGRNARLLRILNQGLTWQERRPGWTLPELTESLASDSSVRVMSFDFPFSIPLKLLQDRDFSQLVGREPFENRSTWAEFVSASLELRFSSTLAKAKLETLRTFHPWRHEDRRFWKKRSTDDATRGFSPLQHKYQNLFAMTLGGVAMLETLNKSGVLLALSPSETPTTGRVAFETYPAAVARHCGFTGNYKKDPGGCMRQADAYLANRNIKLVVADSVRRFCVEYSTAGKSKDDRDPDGADAYLCLVSAICFREGIAEACTGGAAPAVLEQEGCIFAPNSVVP
jgi:hypothetical protein